MTCCETDDVILHVVEGRTSAIRFTISRGGVPFDLSGLTVTLILHRASGELVVPGGTVTPLNQTTSPGQLDYSPVAGDFTWEANLYTIHQPYLLHWKLVDGSGKVGYAPHGAPAIVMVHRA